MAKQRAADEDKVKEDQNKWKKASMIRQRAEDEDKVKEEQNKRSRLCLSKKKADNHKQVKEDQNSRQQKQRRILNKGDRLKMFREATMYNAIFICTCCQQRMFHSNVRLYTNGLEDEINKIKPGLIQDCIEATIPTYVNGKVEIYICLTCV